MVALLMIPVALRLMAEAERGRRGPGGLLARANLRRRRGCWTGDAPAGPVAPVTLAGAIAEASA
jgi:hypothetical protein